MLGLRGCSGFSLAGASRGYSLAVQTSPCGGFSHVVEHGLKGARVSVAEAHGLSRCDSRALQHRLSSCGAQA